MRERAEEPRHGFGPRMAVRAHYLRQAGCADERLDARGKCAREARRRKARSRGAADSRRMHSTHSPDVKVRPQRPCPGARLRQARARVLTTTAAQHCSRHRGPPPPTKKIHKNHKKTQRLLVMQLLLLRKSPQQSRSRPATYTLRPPPGARNGSKCSRCRPAPAAALGSRARQQHAAALHDQTAQFRCKPTNQLGWPCHCLLRSTELAAPAIGRSESRCAVRVADAFRLPSWRNGPAGFCLHALWWYRGFCMTRTLIPRHWRPLLSLPPQARRVFAQTSRHNGHSTSCALRTRGVSLFWADGPDAGCLSTFACGVLAPNASCQRASPPDPCAPSRITQL